MSGDHPKTDTSDTQRIERDLVEKHVAEMEHRDAAKAQGKDEKSCEEEFEIAIPSTNYL